MRDPVALLERLARQPAAFDFYAALRQLECAYPALPRIGQARRPRDEAVRFGQQPSLAFEPAMLAGLQRPEAGAPRLLINFFGLLGANGPMPVHLSEYIRDRLRNVNDPTLARFVDMFQHRMISLLYRAWSGAQPAVSLDRPGADRFAGYVGALIGIGMASLRQRDAVPDFAKLHYAGRLAPHAGNAAGLEAILGDFFQVPVRVQQFLGHWMRLPADGLFRLRGGPHAGTLGGNTVLGKQVWNAQHKFRLLIGPVDMAQARRFLPDAAGMRQLTAWVRQYVGLTQDWDLRLIIQKQSLPGLRLGDTAQLGWTSWLSSKPPAHDDRQLRLTPPRQSPHTSEGAAHG
ncbi:type VI secretion system baseplate subunit TssG [Duganella lactea]|nr:type VI secretion system baseplate subunit TssG [Duganella lactea]